MKSMMSRKLVRNLSVALFIILSFGVSQGDSAPSNIFDLNGGDIEITYNNNQEFKVTVGTASTLVGVAESIVIAGTTGSTLSNTVTVDTSGAPIANIVLKDVTVDVSGSVIHPAFDIVGDSKVNLTLEGSNSLKSGTNHAGIQLAADSELTITGDIQSKLTATGGLYGAGIGGGFGGDGGTVEISGGTVTATGGNSGAGIGGGGDSASSGGGDGGTVEITGGTVTATGGNSGAGIGGGNGGNGGNVTVSDGSVTARGGIDGAGIGGGYGGNGGIVKISDGTVTATGGDFGGGIGGGNSGDGGTVEIFGGSVTARGGQFGAGIGGGDGGDGGTVEISGGSVTATGSECGAGIGGGLSRGGNGGGGGNVTVTDGTVTATGGNLGSGIGGGHSGGGGNVTVTGGSITARGGDLGAGIGGGSRVGGIGIGGGGTVEISGGTVTATGGVGSAGIGGGSIGGGIGGGGGGGSVEISGGVVIASGGDSGNGVYAGTGIGAGGSEVGAQTFGNGADVTITGGTVTASGGSMSAIPGALPNATALAIGPGTNGIVPPQGGTPGSLTIEGGSVSVIDGKDASLATTDLSTKVYPYPAENGNGAPVYLNILTIGSPAVAKGVKVTGGSVDGTKMVSPPGNPAGAYCFKDIYTDANGMIHLWLKNRTTQTGNGTVEITANALEYVGSYGRTSIERALTATLLLGRKITLSPSYTIFTHQNSDEVTVQIKNAGSKDITNLTVTIGGSDADAFTITLPNSKSLAAGASTEFKIKPKQVPVTGTLNATVSVGGDLTETVTYKASFLSAGAVSGITLNKSLLSLPLGSSETLRATLIPETAVNKGVTWTSSAPAVASVDSSGLVTALSPGSADITVTTAEGSYTATCRVTVTLATVIIDFSQLGLDSDGIMQLVPGEVVALLIGGTPDGLEFTSDNLPEWLTLAKNGRLSGTVTQTEGEWLVTIVATAPDGSKVERSFTINVRAAAKQGTSSGCNAAGLSLAGFCGLLALSLLRRKTQR